MLIDLRRVCDELPNLLVGQVLKYLPNEGDISRRQLVFGKIQCQKLNSQMSMASAIMFDEAWYDVTSDVALAEPSHLTSH